MDQKIFCGEGSIWVQKSFRANGFEGGFSKCEFTVK